MKIGLLKSYIATIYVLSILCMQNSALAAAPYSNSLSGDYRLHFEQTFKSCGAKISPVDANVSIEISDSTINLKFPGGFLGISLINAKFDSQTGSFNDQLKQRVSLGPTQANLSLAINGRFVKKGQNAQIQYQVSFEKIADDPEWNCRVTGKGQAKKL